MSNLQKSNFAWKRFNPLVTFFFGKPNKCIHGISFIEPKHDFYLELIFHNILPTKQCFYERIVHALKVLNLHRISLII